MFGGMEMNIMLTDNYDLVEPRVQLSSTIKIIWHLKPINLEQ